MRTERELPARGDAHRRPHVLVVSDDTGLSGFLSEGLIIAGCWVSVVASALQVLEVFRLRSFELALVDVALGGLGASELLRRLGLTDEGTGLPRTDIPILAVAETPEELRRAEVEPDSVSGVVYAPVEIEELALRIFAEVRAWRAAHPGRPWSDEATLARAAGEELPGPAQ